MRTNLFLSLLLLTVFAGTVYAERSAQDPQEGLRYVDMQRCLTGWTELQEESNAIRDRYQALSQGLNAAGEDLLGRKAELETLYQPDSAEFRDASFALQIEEETLRARAEWTQKNFAAEQTALLERGVRQVHEAVESLGAEQGISAVLMQPNELPAIGGDFSPTEALAEMNSRWVLWTNPNYDLTDQVLLRLNRKQ